MSGRIKKAGRRHTVEMLIAALLYMAVLIGSLSIAKGIEPGPMLALLAIAPVLPMVYACYAFYRFYRQMDEMQKRISADAAALTLMAVILASLTLAFLERFGVFVFDDALMWLAPFMIGLWGLIRIAIGGRDC